MLKTGVETGLGSIGVHDFVEISTNVGFGSLWNGASGTVSEVVLGKRPMKTSTGSYDF